MSLNRTRLEELRSVYRDGLLQSVVPFWLRHAFDREHGGLFTAMDRRGGIVDTDKAVWLQGRAVWTFATLYNTVEQKPEWLAAAKHCLDFLREHCRATDGKLYFFVTREGKPLRMRRYTYSECFAAMGSAAYARATGEAQAAADAVDFFTRYLRSLRPGETTPKTDATTRPMRGVAAQMMIIVVAQELRAALGDVVVEGATCTAWIDRAVADIRRYFYKPELKVLMEIVADDGSILDHFDGRTLNPGHAIECAWFILHEAKLRHRDPGLLELGCGILDCMWPRGWDAEFGGLLSFTDVFGKPVQEYSAEMKFWWPHNETEIATLLAWQLTGEARYAEWHRLVHDWSHRVFPDPEFGEWFGYAHRDGRIATQLKGNLWKGPFHLPRMQLYCWRLVEELLTASPAAAVR